MLVWIKYIFISGRLDALPGETYDNNNSCLSARTTTTRSNVSVRDASLSIESTCRRASVLLTPARLTLTPVIFIISHQFTMNMPIIRVFTDVINIQTCTNSLGLLISVIRSEKRHRLDGCATSKGHDYNHAHID